MATAGSFTAHHGFFHDIPGTASPGLQFLKSYISTVDALDQSSASPPLSKYFAPVHSMTTNGGNALTVDQLLPMFAMRGTMLSEFTHSKFEIQAYDLKHDSGKRTAICEMISVSVFKDDSAKEAVKVNEMLVLELSPSGTEDKGVHGLWITSARTHMDPSPVQTKSKEVRASRE